MRSRPVGRLSDHSAAGQGLQLVLPAHLAPHRVCGGQADLQHQAAADDALLKTMPMRQMQRVPHLRHLGRLLSFEHCAGLAHEERGS